MTDTFTLVAGKPTIDKDPDAVLDYAWDWTAWLAENAPADTLADHQIIPEAGINCDSSSVVGSTVVAWLSGGTAGVKYGVTCRITTAAGRIDDRTIYLKVKER